MDSGGCEGLVTEVFVCSFERLGFTLKVEKGKPGGLGGPVVQPGARVGGKQDWSEVGPVKR